jgi:uncharacterized membrane protein YqaE (UPF0057 family)
MLLFLCYVCPPLAVLFMGRPFSAVLNLFLTGLLWAPGVGHALVCYADYKGERGVRRIVGAVNAPKYLQESASPRRRSREVEREVVVVYDNPHVGRNGTYFRPKN